MLPHLNTHQAWAVLAVAIVFEVGGSTSMRLSEGLSRPGPSVMIFVLYSVSFLLNAMVIRTLGLSVAYAVWAGVGTVLTAAVGYVWFREPLTTLKIMSTALIIIGVFGLHLSTRQGAP